MKNLIVVALVLAVFTSCRKDVLLDDVMPKTTNNTTTETESADDTLHRVTLDAADQNVKTLVTDKTLTLVYTEDVNTLFTPGGYDLSYSIRFNEDFSLSALNKFDYTTPGVDGHTTFNWAGNDLKVLNEKTVSNITVNEQPMVKINLKRDFTFVKQYATAVEAQQMQTTLLNTKTDVIKFNTYIVFGKAYPATLFTKPLVYTK